MTRKVVHGCVTCRRVAWAHRDLNFASACVFGAHLRLPTAAFTAGLVWLLVLHPCSHCLSPRRLPQPRSSIWGDTLPLEADTWQTASTGPLGLDPARGQFSCSYSVSLQDTWNPPASPSEILTLLWRSHHFLSAFLPSLMPLCFSRAILSCSGGGEPLLLYPPAFFTSSVLCQKS